MPRATSPTARALRTLELLQARPGITADQLADRLGVTERAARRYVAILREAGIPVESVRGPYGGYRLGRGLRLPPLVFTAPEALGLVMAALDGHHPAADAGDPVGSALGKIIRALPEAVGRPAAVLREHATAAPDRSSSRPDPEIITTVVNAVAAQRRIKVRYRGARDREWETDVDPWAVVVRHGYWYLLCLSHAAGAMRTYRIDRVAFAHELAESFIPPDGLDPVAQLEEHLGSGWEFETRVVFDAPLATVAHWVRGPMGRLSQLDDGARTVLTGTTSNVEMYAGEWLAGIPLPFRVEGGPQLRSAMAALAQKLSDSVVPE